MGHTEMAELIGGDSSRNGDVCFTGEGLVADQLVVEVALLPPISKSDKKDRHAIARAARAAIAHHLGIVDEPLTAGRDHASVA